MGREADEIIIQRLRAALLIIAAGTIFSSVLYPGGYNFLKEPLSALGGIKTFDGLRDNSASRITFSITCITAGIVLVSAMPAAHKKSILLMGTGLLLLPFPHDLFRLAHQIASGLAVAGAYFYCTAYLHHSRREHFTQALFQLIILTYAALHITGSGFREEFQTLALGSIILVLTGSVMPSFRGKKISPTHGEEV